VLPYSARQRLITLRLILCLAFASLSLHAHAKQACVPPPQGILAWWPFDETAGPIARDIIGGRDGTYFGSPPPIPAPGEVKNALKFDGINDFVGVANSPVWHFGLNDFSIELWANFSAPQGGSISEPSGILVGNDNGPGDQNKWFFATGGGYLYFHINSPTLGPNFFPLALFSPTINTWYHLAVTRSGSLYTVYIDGSPVASALNTASIPSPSAFLTIGEAENIGFMNGLLDEVTIYNQALTAAEIYSIYAAGSAGKCKPGSGPGLQITSVNPAVGGNAGQTTVSINGGGFQPKSIVKLWNGAQLQVQGANTEITPSGLLQSTLDLTGLPPSSSWQILVVNPDGKSARAPFTVIAGGAPQLQLEMVGPATVRVGQDADFVILLQNVGSVDAPYATVSTNVNLPSGLINLDPNDQFGQPQSPDQLSLGSNPPYLLTIPVPTGPKIPQYFSLPGDRDKNASGCGRVQAFLNSMFPPPEDLNGPDWNCDRLKALLARVKRIIASLNDEINSYRVMLTAVENRFASNGRKQPLNSSPTCFNLALEIAGLEKKISSLNAELSGLNKYLSDIIAAMKAKKCPPSTSNSSIENSSSAVNNSSTTAASSAGNGNSPTASEDICTVTSWDPNAKAGPEGVGPLGFISGNLLPYTIFFENLPTATAPAQQISVVDPIDPSLDPSTVSIGTLNLGGVDYDLGGGASANRTFDLRPATNALLQVQANVDTSNRRITWALTALDPTTLQLPTNPQVGILPPDTNPPNGEGWVTFSASANQATPPNTTISNQATVTFDVNPPIQTNVWTNTTQPACSSDVTTQFSVGRSGYVYNNASGLFMQTVTLTNNGADILGPFALALDGLSSNATLSNVSGTTACSAEPGSPFAAVDPGATTWSRGQKVTVDVEFIDPTLAGITYTPRVLAGSTNR
jgi:hypothetical protein